MKYFPVVKVLSITSDGGIMVQGPPIAEMPDYLRGLLPGI